MPGRPRAFIQASSPSIVSRAGPANPPVSDSTTPILKSCWALAVVDMPAASPNALMKPSNTFAMDTFVPSLGAALPAAVVWF